MRVSNQLLPLNQVFFLLLLLSPAVHALAVKEDSCSNLQFHSEIEQQGFQSICTGQQPDYLLMSTAVNPLSTVKELYSIRETVKKEVELLRIKGRELKKPAKMLKFIFDHVQGTYLQQYDLEAGFSEMFATKRYNCLTATILYSLLLDELTIKHTIKFMPGHVYLIVYANEIPYLFETTDPIGGFIELNKAVQDKALQGLRVAQYMLSENKQNDKSANFLDSYFIKLNSLEMKGLVGYQYVNLAITKMNKQEYLSAYNYIEKAKIFTPEDELNTLSSQLLGQAIEQADHTSTIRARLLVKLYNTMKTPNKKNIIAEDYKSITYECLAGSFPAPDSIQSIHKIMMDGIKDKDVRAVFEDVYTTNYLYYLSTKASPYVRFSYLYKLFSEGNTDEKIKNMLTQEINEMTEKNYREPEGMIIFDTLASKYPKLMELDNFRYSRCWVLVKLAEDAFSDKNTTLGEELLQKFDTIQFTVKGKDNFCSPASAYSLAASCYYKKGNTTKARATLNKGLTYDPNNWELKEKLKEMR